jgi:putative effector of murein hydrolase LrgA (UPF0299 family)
MSPSIRRVIGFMLLLAAVVTAILNLHRVADLRMTWLPAMLLIFGAVLVGSARRRAS